MKLRTVLGSIASAGVLAAVLAVPAAADTPPDCGQAQAIVIKTQIADNHAASKVTKLTAARTKAHAELAAAVTADTNEDADNPPDAQDAAVHTDQLALAAANALPADGKLATDPTGKAFKVAAAQTALNAAEKADATEDGNGVKESPSDPTDAKLAAAQKKSDNADKALAEAITDKANADKALSDAQAGLKVCQGATGATGADGGQGPQGLPGVDAQIVLSPNVCAEAEIQPGNVPSLIHVVALTPCPATAPPAPASPPVVGSPVVVCPPPPPCPCPAPVSTPAQAPVILAPSNGNPSPIYTLPTPSTPDTSQVGTVPSGPVNTGGGSMAGQLPGTSR